MTEERSPKLSQNERPPAADASIDRAMLSDGQTRQDVDMSGEAIS